MKYGLYIPRGYLNYDKLFLEKCVVMMSRLVSGKRTMAKFASQIQQCQSTVASN